MLPMYISKYLEYHRTMIFYVYLSYFLQFQFITRKHFLFNFPCKKREKSTLNILMIQKRYLRLGFKNINKFSPRADNFWHESHKTLSRKPIINSNSAQNGIYSTVFTNFIWGTTHLKAKDGKSFMPQLPDISLTSYNPFAANYIISLKYSNAEFLLHIKYHLLIKVSSFLM